MFETTLLDTEAVISDKSTSFDSVVGILSVRLVVVVVVFMLVVM